jgi:hypothetical protein
MKDEVIEIKNTYFRYLYDEEGSFISGCHPLPNPTKKYKFVDCDIHPRLWEAMHQMYNHCEYENTYIGMKS